MPYIPQHDRDALANGVRVPETAGELNWLITKAILNYIGKEYRYERLNAALGALEACKLELYRRIVAPYEDKAKEKNGDVYRRAYNG